MSLESATNNVDEDDEEEDLEKLQAEIARMEEEAARITRETNELERNKNAAVSGSTALTTTNGGKLNQTGLGENGEGAVGSEGAATDVDTAKAQALRDAKSVYVGQVDYSTTPVELLSHFEACGTVERVTIVCDKYTGRPKGYAYLEFQTEQAVENAIKLDGSEFKGRHLKVTHKRVNQPAFMLHQQHIQQIHAVSGAGTTPSTGAVVGAVTDEGGRGRGAGRGASFRGGVYGRGSLGGFRGGYRGGAPGGYRGGYRGGGRGGYRGGGRVGGYHPYY